MRIIVFSDIHGNACALKNFVDIMPDFHFDRAVFLGDIFGYYYEQEKCIRMLQDIPNLVWLKGNHDEYAARTYFGEIEESKLIALYGHSYQGIGERFSKTEIEALRSLPSSIKLDCDGKKIGFFHGRPQNDLEGRIYSDTMIDEEEISEYDVVIVGHTHCKIERKVGGKSVLSPGSLGQPRDGKGYGFMIYDTATGYCEFANVEVDNSSLRREIDKRDRGLKKLYEVLEREGTA